MLSNNGFIGALLSLIRERCAAFLGGREHNALIRQGEAQVQGVHARLR